MRRRRRFLSDWRKNRGDASRTLVKNFCGNFLRDADFLGDAWGVLLASLVGSSSCDEGHGSLRSSRYRILLGGKLGQELQVSRFNLASHVSSSFRHLPSSPLSSSPCWYRFFVLILPKSLAKTLWKTVPFYHGMPSAHLLKDWPCLRRSSNLFPLNAILKH